jgi:pimeloyl-ACP methyl ester carboxylesterase
VLAVAGGAAACRGYFPELVTRLAGAHSIIVHDRVGTGTSPSRPGGPGHLEQQADDLRSVVEAAGRGPAVVIAHSLGGPVSLQLAVDHPEIVSGIVLLDPTIIAGSKLVKQLATAARMAAVLLGLPGIGTLMTRQSSRMLARQLSDFPGGPEVSAARSNLEHSDQMLRTAPLLQHFPEDAARLAARLTESPLRIPGVLVTATRRETHKYRVAHEELVKLTGLELQAWPGTHVLHLQHPARVAQLVAEMTILPRA